MLLKDTLAFHISVLHREFLKYVSDELKKLGLSFGQIPMILYVGKHPGCTQAELTKALRLDWGYSQRSIKKLSDTGFMEKQYNTGRSGNCLNLTQSGMNAFDVSHRVFKSWDDLKTEALSAEEKQILISLLSKITAERKESC